MSRRTGSALWSTTEALHALQHSPPVSGAKAEEELGHKARATRATVANLFDWFGETGALKPR